MPKSEVTYDVAIQGIHVHVYTVSGSEDWYFSIDYESQIWYSCVHRHVIWAPAVSYQD